MHKVAINHLLEIQAYGGTVRPDINHCTGSMACHNQLGGAVRCRPYANHSWQ